MWENGDLVWANVSNNPCTYLPGMILDSHMPEIGILVSFFDLQNPRYFLPRQLHPFEPNFKTLISNSQSSNHRQFVNRSLRFLFRSISNSISCPCSRVLTVKHVSPRPLLFSTESALGFLRDAAVSPFVPPEALAEATSCSAQLLCFRRYTIDYDTSKAVYEEIELGSHSLHGRDGIESIDNVNGKKITSLLQAQSLHETLNNLRCLAVHPMHPERARLDTGNQIELLINLRDSLLQDVSSCRCSNAHKIADSALSSDSCLKACKTTICTNEATEAYLSKSRVRCEPGAAFEALELVESAPTPLQQISMEQPLISDDDPLITPVNSKRKMDENVRSENSVKRSKVDHQGSSIGQSKQLIMKFRNYNNLPSKGELIKRFCRFGKIDALRTEVYAYTGSAKVVFEDHTDAVRAMKYGKSKKIAFGQGSVYYWLGQHQGGNERKQTKVSEPVPKSCLKTKSSSGKRDAKRKKVRFRIETNC